MCSLTYLNDFGKLFEAFDVQFDESLSIKFYHRLVYDRQYYGGIGEFPLFK